MRIIMLLVAARMIAAADPGCAGGAEEASARVEPVAVTVMESSTPRPLKTLNGQEVSRSAATSGRAQSSAQAVADDALIKPVDSTYSVDGVPQAGLMPMYGAILLQRVSDFETFKTAFEESRPQRQRAGFVAQGLMRGVGDPQLVAVWLAVTDVDKAKQYFADKTIRARLRAAGALGAPEIGLSSNVAAKMEPGRTDLHAALVRLAVDDVAAFKASFAAAELDREAAGIVGYSLGQDVDDDHLLYVYLQSEDPALLQSYVRAKQTKQSWRDAGVRGNPRVVVVKEGELTLCRE
jgi:quinol monooxygenase YgiN